MLPFLIKQMENLRTDYVHLHHHSTDFYSGPLTEVTEGLNLFCLQVNDPTTLIYVTTLTCTALLGY